MKKLTVLLLCAALCFSGCGADDAIEYEASSESAKEQDDAAGAEAETPDPEEPESIFVYICGAVRTPGVYELPSGSRVFEAVEAAGGLAADADTRSLNQAELLSDGVQITVLTLEEAKQTGTDGKPDAGTDDGRVDINTADRSALMTLPGVGEARAEAILAYREENGAFETPQDICRVAGIKEKLYARIEGLIKV